MGVVVVPGLGHLGRVLTDVAGYYPFSNVKWNGLVLGIMVGVSSSPHLPSCLTATIHSLPSLCPTPASYPITSPFSSNYHTVWLFLSLGESAPIWFVVYFCPQAGWRTFADLTHLPTDRQWLDTFLVHLPPPLSFHDGYRCHCYGMSLGAYYHRSIHAKLCAELSEDWTFRSDVLQVHFMYQTLNQILPHHTLHTGTPYSPDRLTSSINIPNY